MRFYPWVVEYLDCSKTCFKVFDTEREARRWAEDSLLKIVAVWEL